MTLPFENAPTAPLGSTQTHVCEIPIWTWSNSCAGFYTNLHVKPLFEYAPTAVLDFTHSRVKPLSEYASIPVLDSAQTCMWNPNLNILQWLCWILHKLAYETPVWICSNSCAGFYTNSPLKLPFEYEPTDVPHKLKCAKLPFEYSHTLVLNLDTLTYETSVWYTPTAVLGLGQTSEKSQQRTMC